MTELAPPEPGAEPATAWVGRHLAGLYRGKLEASPGFRGGQTAADAALAAFDVAGYAARRNEVGPDSRRGASRLSPFIRHGLLTLPRVWASVAGGPARDVSKFRDELMWQEYARHVYARLGKRTGKGLRAERYRQPTGRAWPQDMECVRSTVAELHEDGWLPNQARMWLASQWVVRTGHDWRDGEDQFLAHLLDGSRAANRLGWQWTAGTATGRSYGFSRYQVEKRAPGLCTSCKLQAECPIADWQEDEGLTASDIDQRLQRDPDPEATAGPSVVQQHGDPEAVWITAESLGDADPALASNPGLPVVFVFDQPLLARLQLSAKRLVFLVETLADLAQRHAIAVLVGSPVEVLAGRSVATTYAPVPGWRSRAAAIGPVQVHPWPWLVRPGSKSVASFSAWRKGIGWKQ